MEQEEEIKALRNELNKYRQKYRDKVDEIKRLKETKSCFFAYCKYNDNNTCVCPKNCPFSEE